MPQYASSDLFCQEESAYSAIDNGRVIARFSFLDATPSLPRAPNGDVKSADGGEPHVTRYSPHVTEIAFDGTHVFIGMPVNGNLPGALTVYHRDHALNDAIMQGLTEE